MPRATPQPPPEPREHQLLRELFKLLDDSPQAFREAIDTMPLGLWVRLKGLNKILHL